MISVKKNKGFTLVELMVTLGLAGIFMSFAIPGYKDYLDRAKAVESITTALLVRSEIDGCLLNVSLLNLEECLDIVDWNIGVRPESLSWTSSNTSIIGLNNSDNLISNTSKKNLDIMILKSDIKTNTYVIFVASKNLNQQGKPFFAYSYNNRSSLPEIFTSYYLPDGWVKSSCWVINKKGDCYEF